MRGKLIIFSAPSGSGKTTIVKHLLGLNMGLAFSISATSRIPRENEINGRDYYFITPEEFREKVSRNMFLEWEEVYANQYYGTLREDVERLRNEGTHVLFDIDVVGGLNLKKVFGEEALAVFVQPPSIEELENRLRSRNTDSDQQLTKRLAKAKHELTFAPRFDYILINEKLNTALEEAERIVSEFLGKEKK